MRPTRPEVVVITGASTGVGRAAATAFAHRGARVTLHARGRARLEAAADHVRAGGGEALVVPTDVADADQVEAAAGAVRDELEEGGLLLRYPTRRGHGSREGAFVACSFWLAECLARQGRHDEARTTFDHATAAANDLGPFSEEYDTRAEELLGNVPQALTHLAHIGAAVALAEEER